MAGLDQPTAGRVLLDGTDVTGWNENRRTRMRRDRIGFVFQDFSLMPYLTAAENVALPARLAGRRPDPTSVRRALARALVTQPAVLLADEPTGSLDSATAREVLRLLRSTVDELGQTTVMVTHDPVAAAHADTVVFLVDGRVAGHMNAPNAEAVAAQLAHLDQLTGGRR